MAKTAGTVLEDGAVVHDVARLMRVAFEREIRDLGLTRTQWWVISVLVRMDGATQSEIAAYMQIDRSPLGKVIDTLERDGWLERRPDASDRRINRIFRSPRVDKVLPSMAKAANNVFLAATREFAPRERDQLLELLGRMRSSLKALVRDGDGA
jgi:DNA-binding MarR family transcriptional regulator